MTTHRQAGSAGRTRCGVHNFLPRDQIRTTDDPRAVTCKACLTESRTRKGGKGIRRNPRRRK